MNVGVAARVIGSLRAGVGGGEGSGRESWGWDHRNLRVYVIGTHV